MLKKLGIRSFTANMIDEINKYRNTYDKDIPTLGIVEAKTFKKLILSEIFECFSSVFNFDYNVKLKFTDNDDNFNVYLSDYEDLSFDQVFYKLYYNCFCMYLKNIHTYENEELNNKLYSIIRMAIISKNEKIIEKVAKAMYSSLLEKNINVKYSETDFKISKEELKELITNTRNEIDELTESVLKLSINQVSNVNIRNIYRCFSCEIFDNLDSKEKLKISRLLYSYFKGNDGKYFSSKNKKNIQDTTSNKECLKIVIQELMQNGKSMSIRKKNIDTIIDVLSGLPYIYEMETDITKLNYLDDLKNLIDEQKKNNPSKI